MRRLRPPKVKAPSARTIRPCDLPCCGVGKPMVHAEIPLLALRFERAIAGSRQRQESGAPEERYRSAPVQKGERAALPLKSKSLTISAVVLAIVDDGVQVVCYPLTSLSTFRDRSTNSAHDSSPLITAPISVYAGHS